MVCDTGSLRMREFSGSRTRTPEQRVSESRVAPALQVRGRRPTATANRRADQVLRPAPTSEPTVAGPSSAPGRPSLVFHRPALRTWSRWSTRSAGPGPCRTRMSGTRSSASSPSEPDRRFTGRPGRPRHRVVTGGAPHNIGIPFRVNAENAGSSRPRGAPPPDRGTRGAVRQHGTCLAVGKHPVAAKCGRATRTARFI